MNSYITPQIWEIAYKNPLLPKIMKQFTKKHHQEKSLVFIAPIDKSCIHHDKKKRDSELSKRSKISVQEVFSRVMSYLQVKNELPQFIEENPSHSFSTLQLNP